MQWYSNTSNIIHYFKVFWISVSLQKYQKKTVSHCRGYKFLAESSNYWQSMIFLVLSHSLEKVKKKIVSDAWQKCPFVWWNSRRPSLHYVSKRTGWLGGWVFSKCQFLLVQNYVYANIVGGWFWKSPKIFWCNSGMVPRMWHHKDWTVSAKILFSK